MLTWATGGDSGRLVTVTCHRWVRVLGGWPPVFLVDVREVVTHAVDGERVGTRKVVSNGDPVGGHDGDSVAHNDSCSSLVVVEVVSATSRVGRWDDKHRTDNAGCPRRTSKNPASLRRVHFERSTQMQAVSRRGLCPRSSTGKACFRTGRSSKCFLEALAECRNQRDPELLSQFFEDALNVFADDSRNTGSRNENGFEFVAVVGGDN